MNFWRRLPPGVGWLFLSAAILVINAVFLQAGGYRVLGLGVFLGRRGDRDRDRVWRMVASESTAASIVGAERGCAAHLGGAFQVAANRWGLPWRKMKSQWQRSGAQKHTGS